jgi:dipeptidyl aminopeptidase/acylaminoacyl peptidase
MIVGAWYCPFLLQWNGQHVALSKSFFVNYNPPFLIFGYQSNYMHKTLLLPVLLAASTAWCGALAPSGVPAASSTPAPSGAPAAGDTMTIPQALRRYNISTPVISPDGLHAVVTVAPATAPADSMLGHLWMLDIKTKKFRQFTNSPKSESQPKWSPDSKTLAYITGRSGSAQVWTIDMDGGEGQQLTHAKEGIAQYEWAGDGKSLLYIAQEELSDSIKKRQGDKFDEEVVSESSRPSGLYQFDLATKPERLLFKRKWSVDEMKLIPGTQSVLLLGEALPAEELPQLQLARFNLTDSSFTLLSAPPKLIFGEFLPAPDGLNAAFVGPRDDGPVPHDLFTYDLGTKTYRNITTKTLDRPIDEYRFIDHHSLLALVQNGFHRQLFIINDDGKVEPYTLKDDVLSFDRAADGTLVYVKTGFTQLPEVYVTAPGGQPEKVSQVNAAVPTAGLVEPKLFTYKSFDGRVIEGALYKPAAASQGRLPMIAYIHGGPTGAFTATYSAWVQLLVQQGYAVFCPNIRGSTGYGTDFMTSNRKDWGGNDYKDMMAGIDYLIKNEGIDSARLGIAGWSYGGYMAEWAITQTTRFKASVSGAGMANLASEFGTENQAAYDHWFWGPPYENGDLFAKHSPIGFLKRVKTPTLIIQGDEDVTDPKGQSQELYRGLRYYHVPCELVLYPREPHGFRELNHNVDFYRRMLLWFKTYLPTQPS